MCENKFCSWPCLDKSLCFPRKARMSILSNFSGVVAGSLTVSITDPNSYLAGASGGVYALMRYLALYFNTSQNILNHILTCGVMSLNINIDSFFFSQNIPTWFNTYMQRSLGERGGKLGRDGVRRSSPHHFHHTCWWAKTLGKTFFESPVPEWPMSKITISSPLNFSRFHFPSPLFTQRVRFPWIFSPCPNSISNTTHMHLSHWHYSRRWCWGRGLLQIHSRGKGKCHKQTNV